MDIFTFISELTKAVIWPITVILLAILLRNPILELFPLLRRLKYKELELEFAQEISELKAEAMIVEQGAERNTLQVLSTSSNLLNLVTFSTRAAIMEAWLEVESAAISVASSFWRQPPTDTFRNMPRLGEYLLQCKVIDEKQLIIFNKLRDLRNKAVHAQELQLSETDAKSYVQLASDLARHIREA